MAWGLEARVPFLDKAFLEVAMNIDPKQKMFSKGSSQQIDEALSLSAPEPTDIPESGAVTYEGYQPSRVNTNMPDLPSRMS